MVSDNHELRVLLDKQACSETLTRYCRALDWLDEDALKTVFTPDADIDYGFFKGRGDAFIPTVHSTFPTTTAAPPHRHNPARGRW